MLNRQAANPTHDPDGDVNSGLRLRSRLLEFQRTGNVMIAWPPLEGRSAVARFVARVVRPALVGGAAITALLTSATAAAEPPPRPPNCTAADLAGIASGVAAATSAYLFTHPDVNDFYSSLRGRPQDEVPEATRVYFDANPQAHADLVGIRQPLVDFRNRCGIAPPDQPLGQ